MEKESFEGDRADWKRQADNEINKITRRIDEYLTFESDDPIANNERNSIRSDFSKALKTFEENICSSIKNAAHKFYFDKELHEHLAQFDDIDDEAEMLSQRVRRNAEYVDARKQINAEKAKLRENEAESKLDKYLRRFNKAINYKPCSYNHEINLKKVLVMNEQEMDAFKNRTQHLISKELNDQEFAEQLELIESSLLEMIAIAKNYRKLTGVTFSLMTPPEKKKHAEDELNAHIQQFNKVINYRPCSFTHDGERNHCLNNYDQQVIECRESIEFLIDKPIKFKQFDKEMRALLSPLVDTVNTAEKYRLLNDITHSKQTTKAKSHQDLLNRAKITIDSIKERFDVELNLIENPVLKELNEPFKDARKSVENKIAAHREKLKLDIMSMDDTAAIEANLKECVNALECDLKKLQEDLQPYRDYQKEIFPIRERAENDCVQLMRRADNLKLLIINRDSDDARELNSKCHKEYYAKKIECAIRDHYKQTIDTKQLQAKHKELNDELNEIIGKVEHSISTQSYDELHQKLEEIKTQFNNRLALEPKKVRRRSLNVAKLTVKFNNDLKSVLRDIKMKNLTARSTSDFMTEVLQPFSSMVTEAEDLILPQVKKQITEEKSELITQFNKLVDFKSDDPDLMARRTTLLSKFKKIQQSSSKHVSLDLDELVAGSTSNYMTTVLQPFISLVQEATELRDKHGDGLLLQMEQELNTKYKELKAKFYNTLDFECDNQDIIERRKKLYSQFLKNAKAYLAKEYIDENELIAGSISDMVTKALKPFTFLVEQADDLKDKHGDNLLSQFEDGLNAKFKELKAKFLNSLDFECGNQDIIERRKELQSQFLEASKEYFASDDINENELIARSISDIITETLESFTSLVDDAENLRKEFDFAKSQMREEVDQKLEELKEKLDTFLDFETNDSSLSLSMSNLRVKFENDSRAALKAFELKNLVTKTGSDYMEGLLLPFRSMVQEADDLRDKHGDELVSQLEKELNAKFKELKAKFHSTLDFECDNQDIIERRKELQSQFLEASEAYLASDDIDQNELIARSIPNVVNQTFRPFVLLVDDAKYLRDEHEDTKSG